MVDGSIIINTELDNTGLKKGLPGIKKSAAEIDKSMADINAQIKNQEKEVQKLAAEYAKLKAQADQWVDLGVDIPYDPNNSFFQQFADVEDKLNSASEELDKMRAYESDLAKEAERAALAQQAMDNATQSASVSVKHITKRVGGLVKRVLFFSVIAIMLRHIREWMARVLQTNDEFMASLSQLKGSLLTAFQPIWEVILPWLNRFVQILSKVVMWVAAFFSWLTGKSLSASAKNAKALNEQASALEDVGSAADEAAGSLADFDEVNVISQTEAGGGAGAGEIGAPSFDFDQGELSDMASLMEKIGDYVLAIGAGLASWLILRKIFPQWQKSLGLAMAIAGAVLFVRKYMEAWTEGIDWENFLGMLAGAAFLIGGLGLAFGATGAAIGALVTGIAMLVLGFKEWIETGELSNEAFATIEAGILLVGGAIALLTGSWIPLAVAAVAGLFLAVLKAFGDTEQFIEGLKTSWQGVVEFFKGVFTGDLDMALGGITKIFEGLKQSVGAIVEAFKNMFNSFLDWLDEKTNGKISGIIEWVRTFLNSEFERISKMVSGVLDGLMQILSGVTEFLAGVFTGDWDRAWQGLVNILKGAVNLIASLVEGMINKIINGINALIRGFNKVLSLGDGIAESIFGTTVRIPEIPQVSIPRLAQGTVVPANREFLAVLGDNKREPEVVSPLSTIRQAVAEALAANGGGSAEQITLLRQQNEILMALLEKEITLGEPNASFGRFANRSIEKYAAVSGVK